MVASLHRRQAPRRLHQNRYESVAFIALGITACSKAREPGSPGRIDGASMRRIGTVDERFQSYNIEMVEGCFT